MTHISRATVAVLASTILAAGSALLSAQEQPLPPTVRGEDGTPWEVRRAGVTRSAVRQAQGTGTLDVAIVASAAGDVGDALFSDPQQKLLATGAVQSVTVIHAGLETPELVDLLAFDAILVWSNFDFLDPELLGDRLADYVDFGGGAVVAVFATTSDVPGRLLAGRWADDGYAVIQPQQGSEAGPAALGTIHDPAHPLVAGVGSFSGGSLSARPTTTQLMPGATLVADWDDGKPLVAFRDDLNARRVDLGFYPPSDDVNFLYWDADTDGDRLLANALAHVAGQEPIDVELRLLPLVAPSGVDLTTDPAGLPGQLCDAVPLPDSFVVELWTSDLGALNSGIVGFYVDLAFDPQVLQADGLVHAALFPILQEGQIDNAAGMILNFGGSTLASPPGIAPEWARLGYVQMSAAADGAATVFSTLGLGGIGVFGRPPPLPSEIFFGSATYSCLTDLSGDGLVDAFDLAELLGAWGDNPGHPADFSGDGVVDAFDLAVLLGSWGPCCE